MTVILPFGRAVARQVLPRSNSLLSRFTSSNYVLRASDSNTGDQSKYSTCRAHFDGSNILLAVRRYATTAASRPAGRPKAHTGRAAAQKSSTGRAKTTPKKKPATKPKAKKPKRKTKPKPKPKPKARSRPSRPLSAAAINRARITKTKALKEKALLNEPKQLPASAWAIYFARSKTGVKSLAESVASTREAAQNFKQLSPEEHEHLNHTANQNKAKNNTEYKKWLSQYTPTEIKEANNARKQLSSEKKVKEGKKKAPVRLIKDDRLVKQPRNAYTYFTIDRFASGDFKNMLVPESARLIGREWKALSHNEKKPFEDKAQADKNRYNEEATTVYGKAPARQSSRRASSST